MQPSVSIVIPTHRRPRDIRALLDSLAQQVDVSFEVIVVSNFEDPRLGRIISGWSAPAPISLKVVGAQGVNRARNAGLTEAKGAWVLFLDDDCRLPDSRYLARLQAVHRAYPDALAVGGCYLSHPEITNAGRHYNWICNAWLGARFDSAFKTKTLIGGCVSYVRTTLLQLNMLFDENIVYGGAETEFHERLLRKGQTFVFDPRLSVIHECSISSLDFTRKAYLQGYGKAQRGPTNTFGEPQRAITFWDTFLRGSFYQSLYRSAFASGERRAALKRAPSTTILSLLGLLLSVAIVPGTMRRWWRSLTVALRVVKVRAYWQVVRMRDHLHRRGIDAFWFAHWIVCEALGRWNALVVHLYWRIHAFITSVYWKAYGMIMSIKGCVSRGWTSSYWWVYGRVFATKAFAIRWYWTLFPVVQHLKHNWRRPLSLLDVKMPLTHPSLDTQRGSWIWPISISELTDRLDAVATRSVKLGIQGILISVQDYRLKSNGTDALSTIIERGLRIFVSVPVFTPWEELGPPGELSYLVHVPVFDERVDLDDFFQWLSQAPVAVDARLQLDRDPRSVRLKDWLRGLAACPKVKGRFLQLRRQWDSLDTFADFHWFHGFSLVAAEAGLDWSTQYLYVPEEEHLDVREIQPSSSEEIDISVVIPHHADFSNLCVVLEALAGQSMARSRFEVILVDNGISAALLTEPQVDRIKAITCGMNVRLVVIESRDPALFLSGHARNEGVIRAKGKVIQFLDSDIVVATDLLDHVWRAMGSADVLMAKRRMLRPGVTKVPSCESDLSPEDWYHEDSYWELYKAAPKWTDLADYWKYTCTYCLAIKSDWLKLAGPFEPAFKKYGFEDVDLGFRLFNSGAKFAFDLPWVHHLYPSNRDHNYHVPERREKALLASSRIFFLVRPHRDVFVLCQGYHAPRLGVWIHSFIPYLNRRSNPEVVVHAE